VSKPSKASEARLDRPQSGADAGATGRDDDARARLLASAGPVFARRGFDRATVREICGLAGVNIASVGYYFGDKFGLYREVFRMIRTRCHQEHPDPQWADEAGLVGSPREHFYALVHHLLSGMLARDDSGWESQLMMREMNHPTEVFAEMVDESFRPHFNRLVTTIAALSPESTPVHVLEQLALSAVGQCLYYRVGAGVVRQLIPAERLASEFTVDALARHITAVTIAAAEHGLSVSHAKTLGESAGGVVSRTFSS
jgi:AcrR family transcriptional regulator